MTIDGLRVLRDANPVPGRPGYSEDQISRNVAGIVSAPLDLGEISPAAIATVAGRRPHRRGLVPGLAVAAVVAVAATSTVLLAGADHRSGPAVGGASQVVCRIGTAGSPPTNAEVARARAVIATRVQTLGSVRETFAGHGAEIRFTPHGISAARAASACVVAPVTVRPLVLRALPSTLGDTPGGSEHVRWLFPLTEAEFARLSAAKQTELVTELAREGCNSTPQAGSAAPVLLCSSTGGQLTAYALGPAVITGPQIASARAEAPGSAGGSVEWSVRVTLRKTGQAALAKYTRAHHYPAATTGGTPRNCAVSAVPCADYLAYTVGNDVLAAAITMGEIPAGAPLQISGQFTKATATKLAADLDAAALKLALVSPR